MTIDEIKSLKKGDVFTRRLVDSHNDSLFVYKVEASENRPIGWVIVVILMYKIDLNYDSRERIFINKKYGYSLTDDDIRHGEKHTNSFLRSEVERVFNGS